jgi:hypothetical protein
MRALFSVFLAIGQVLPTHLVVDARAFTHNKEASYNDALQHYLNLRESLSNLVLDPDLENAWRHVDESVQAELQRTLGFDIRKLMGIEVAGKKPVAPSKA